MDASETNRLMRRQSAPKGAPPSVATRDTGLTQVSGSLTGGGPASPPNPWVMHGKWISYNFGVVIGNAQYMGDGTLNAQAIYINGQPVTSMVEAPQDGSTYGRANATWVRTPNLAANADIDGVAPSTTQVVPSSGLRSVTGGQLATLQTISKNGLIPAINEVNAALKSLSSGAVLWGSFNATNGVIVWSTASGQSGNALPTPTVAMTGKYLTCAATGSTPPTGAPAGSYPAGDQLLCDGTRWTHVAVNVGTVFATSVIVNPTVLGQNNVQAALASLQTYANTTDVGAFTDPLGQTVQSLRSPTPNLMPPAGARSPGELWVNFADKQIGVIDNAQNPQPFVGVRFYSTQTNYAVGDHIVYQGAMYRCVTANPPGAFNPAQWTLAGGAVSVGDSPPANPQPGNLWFDSVGAQLFIWYTDSTSSQWVIAVNQNPPGNLVQEAPSDSAAYGRENISWVPVLPIDGGTMGGPITLAGDPTQPLHASSKRYTDGKLALAGGTMTGPMVLAADPATALQPSTKQYSDTKVAKAGDSMSGLLTLSGQPTAALHAAPKSYVDTASPIGGMMMWSGVSPPPNWLLCNGQVYQNIAIPLLAPILNNAFNAGTAAVAGASSAVPNLTLNFPRGVGPGAALGVTGGEAAHTLLATEMPAHAHNINDPTHTHGLNDPGHAHTVYDPGHVHGYSDPAHNHGLNDPGHAHSLADPGHAHNIATGGHSHGLDHQVGTSSGGPNNAGGATWLITTVRTDTAGNLGGNTDARGVGLGVYGAGTGCYNSASGVGITIANHATSIGIYGAATGQSVVGAATGITLQNAGGGAAHNTLPPFVAINFIIRYQ